MTVLGRESGRTEALAGELSGDVRSSAVGDQPQGDVVVLAVAHAAVGDRLGSFGNQLAGEVVIDITDPVRGLRAIDAGPLARAHELEALGYLHVASQQGLGTGFGSALKVLA